jgi:hypothetical protein
MGLPGFMKSRFTRRFSDQSAKDTDTISGPLHILNLLNTLGKLQLDPTP